MAVGILHGVQGEDALERPACQGGHAHFAKTAHRDNDRPGQPKSQTKHPQNDNPKKNNRVTSKNCIRARARPMPKIRLFASSERNFPLPAAAPISVIPRAPFRGQVAHENGCEPAWGAAKSRRLDGELQRQYPCEIHHCVLFCHQCRFSLSIFQHRQLIT
jgi:hypothetical protein